MKAVSLTLLCASCLLTAVTVAAEAMVASAGARNPGGDATHHKQINRDAFSHASANMSFEREIDFKVGNGFFKRLWVTAPASTQSADGLGPLYNARSCQRCHLKDGRGHPPNGADDDAVSMFLRVSIPPQDAEQQALLDGGRVGNIPEPAYGLQLQDFAIPGHRAEYRLGVRYDDLPVALGDGTVVTLRSPTYTAEDLGFGPLHPQAQLSPRVAQQMLGLGLLEAIAEDDIVAAADPDDRDGDGISGRPNRVWSGELGRVALGRFGHKAGMPSISEQSQAAFNGDIGISVPLHPDAAGDCTVAQTACRAAPNGNSPQQDNLEADRRIVDLVVFYARNLAVPARRDADHPDVVAGEALFHASGCAACHTPSHRTRGDEAVAIEQRGQTIWPYTDLLLHDMGEGLADHRPEALASGSEWRTAPLWGIGLTPVVNGHDHYLHDGRARGVLEAVLWHDGEARAARDSVAAMSKTERDQLVRFVESL
ncbi:MAG: thiol oxidoreductase [Chromatiaceae bacterium]|nr:thiol oxidoreductase [Chromatiaceae bacterium]MCP5421923.1 thiol oxidoreductase [Chromatiaceae bacterium]